MVKSAYTAMLDLLLKLFGDVVLYSDAAEIPIVRIAFKGDVRIPLVVLVVKGEEKPSQDLIV